MVFWGLVIVVAGLYLAMMVLTVPVLLAEANGLWPLDFRAFGYSFADVQRYLDAISEEGLATYLGPQHQLDLIFPLAVATMFVVGFRRFLTPVPALVMTVIAVAGAVADYSENALVATILTTQATADQVALASTATMVKQASAAVCFGVLIWLAVRALRDRRAAARPKGRAARKPAAKSGARSSNRASGRSGGTRKTGK